MATNSPSRPRPGSGGGRPSKEQIDLNFEAEGKLRRRLDQFLKGACPCCGHRYNIREVVLAVGEPLQYDNLYRFLRNKQHTLHPDKIAAVVKWLTEQEKRRAKAARS